MKDLTGKVALVTGASRGIGLQVAHSMVARGARLGITGRGHKALRAAMDERGGERSAVALPGRADDPVHQDEATSELFERFGRLDILVNNAGINPVYGQLCIWIWTRRARRSDLPRDSDQCPPRDRSGGIHESFHRR